MPPAPKADRISYGPSRVETDSEIAGFRTPIIQSAAENVSAFRDSDRIPKTAEGHEVRKVVRDRAAVTGFLQNLSGSSYNRPSEHRQCHYRSARASAPTKSSRRSPRPAWR